MNYSFLESFLFLYCKDNFIIRDKLFHSFFKEIIGYYLVSFSDSSEESSNSSTTCSKSPPQLSPQNPIYVDLQPTHNGHNDSLLMMTSPQMALLTPQIKENHELVNEVAAKYPSITVKVMSCGKLKNETRVNYRVTVSIFELLCP